MGQYCTYCNTLHRAFSEVNYCSKKGDELSVVRSNAYYFQSNNLDSGDHISRLSIRTINRGYQTHFINGKEYLLDKDQYLVVPEGASFESYVKTNNPIEGLLVAFSSHDIDAFQYWKNSTDAELLDNPFDIHKEHPTLEAISLPQNITVTQNAQLLKEAIKNGHDHSLYYEEHFFALLAAVIQDLNKREQKINVLRAKKSSTKKEIYKRINTAKEYINCNLNKTLDLKSLSQTSTMSPFHFLRSFKAVFDQSPYQYIKQRRLEKAKFLLRDTDHSLDEIISQIGLEDKSSFLRFFKKMTGFTTTEYKMLSTV